MGLDSKAEAAASTPWRTVSNPRIFQIAYDSQRMYSRAVVLRNLGYDVQSVLGNQAAKDVLISWPNYDVFIIGHDADDIVRLAMVQFIRASYPRHPIVALNSAPGMQLDALEYNAPVDESQVWISLVQKAAGAHSAAPHRQ